MDAQELKDMLVDTQELLNEAIANLETYVSETGDSNAKAYIVDHLKIIASNDHGFLSRDISIDDLIERVDEDFE